MCTVSCELNESFNTFAFVPPDTKDRITYAALILFARKGYMATSVADILHDAGVNAGSLYYFFPGKQDVLLAVLDAYLHGIHPMLLQPAWKDVADPVDRVFALLARYRNSLLITECTYGCPIGSIALEMHEPDPPVRALLAANFAGWIEAIEQCFVEAGDRFPPTVDRRDAVGWVRAHDDGRRRDALAHPPHARRIRRSRTHCSATCTVDSPRSEETAEETPFPPSNVVPLPASSTLLNPSATMLNTPKRSAHRTVLGTILQLAMVIAGHSNKSIAALFAVGGMGFSLVAGVVYAMCARGGSTSSLALGGLVAGAVCAAIGIFVSYMLGDVPATLLALGTVSSAVTGAIGGMLGRFCSWRVQRGRCSA